MPRRREAPRKDRASGYYVFDEIVGFKPNKRRVRFSLKTKDINKARFLWEQEYRNQWSTYYGIESPKKLEPASFPDIARKFVEYERDIKKIKEWRIFQGRLKIIGQFWGDINLHEIDSQRLSGLDKFLQEKGRSHFTVNHYFSLLKTLFNYAIKEERFHGKNPILNIKPYVVDEKRREYSAKEIEKILVAVERIEKEAKPDACIQRYAKRIILFLLLTGMRLGEVLNLRWDNIQEDRMILKRTETKQRKEKIIPISLGIKELLINLKKESLGEFVLPLRRKGGIMKAAWADNLIKKIRKYSGIQDFIFHNIRHTASNIMISEGLGRGIGLADIMKVLGHSQMETTLKYTHPDFDRMKKAVEILEENIKKKD